jgi:hypothetical protein
MRRLIFILLGLWIFTSKAQNITRLEYFIDTDPGYGSATSIPVTPDPSVATSFNMVTSGISYGVHFLFARAEDANGNWSESSMVPVIIGEYTNPGNLVQMEYFIDNDPGFGLATQRTVAPGKNLSQAFTLDISGFSNGVHHFFVRVKDEDGIWSLTQHTVFFTQDLATADIVRLEYFIDNDPGYGLGKNVPVTEGKDVSKTFVIDLTGISPGIHELYVRAKNSVNRWSMVQISPILAIDPAVPDIVQLEYFFDTDPGYGAGIQVPVTSGQDVSQVFNMDTTGLSPGRHVINIRVKNAGNDWSDAGYQEFSIFRARIFLEGLFNPSAGIMNAAQNESGNQWGPDIADHITLQLRDQNPPHGIFFEKEIPLGINGFATLLFNQHLDPYYVAIRHRNSIETWSAAPVSIPDLTTTYDFTSSASLAYGDNMKPMGSVFAIWGGDINQDGIIDSGDMNPVENASIALTSGYVVEDVNGDGLVDSGDMNIVENNSIALVTAITP